MAGSATSTLDIVLKDDVSAAAKAVAASLEKVQAEAKHVDEALAKSGTRDGLQSRLKALGASRAQIEGVAKAWGDYAKAEELAADKSKWTGKQAAAVKNWENVTVAGLRAVRGEERAREFATAADAKKAEERREREAKKRVEEAERAAKAEADASRRAAEVVARDEQRRQEQATRDSRRQTETEARDRRRLAEQDERDERQRVERRLRDDHMLAERTARDQQRAALAQRHHEEHIAEVRAHGEAHHGFRNYLLQSAAIAVSAHGIMSVIEGTIEHGAEYQHKLVALRNTGRTPEEIAEMNRASHAAIRGVPTSTLTENLEVLTETVGAFGSVEHAMEHLPFMTKAASILHAVAGDKIGESAGQMGNSFAKFFEMRGTAGNGEVFEHEASEMMKSMVFTGGNVNPRELLNFAQQAKSSLQNYSIEFLSRIAPSLIGEVGGDRAGTQANAFNSVLLGKANDAKQAAAWLKYGLIDRKQMTGKGDKMTGWTGGAIYHTDEFLRNPLEAMEKYLLPALEKKGVNINDPLELTKVLGTLFRNINAAAFANELANPQNRARLHKDAGLLDKIETPDAMYRRLLTTDPTFALVALKASLGNFLTTLSSPVMEPAARFLSGFAENLNNLAIVAHDHPVEAVTGGLAAAGGALYAAGKLSYGLLNGFGNATFGAAAGEMAMAGHEQLAAGRMFLAGAEASRAGALAHDLPGAVPIGGKAAVRAAEREGAVLAEGAAEAAIGTRVAGAIEGALGKGALSVGAMEIAAAAGVTLTAGTVALVGLSAAAIIAALRATTPPKKHASDDPDFGNPFAPGKGIDYNDPKYRDPDGMTEEERKDAAKPWYDRNGGAHPRGTVQSQKDTDRPGHWVRGPHGRMIWALENLDPMKNAPYFSTAPLDDDGHVKGMLPYGWVGDRVPVDPSTGTIFGLNRMPTDPRLYQPSDMPLPPPRPVEPAAPPPPATSIDGNALRHDDGTPGPAAPVAPQVDTSPAEEGLMHLMSLSSDAGAHMTDALNVVASPTVDVGSINAASAAVDALIAKLGQVGAAANAARAAVAGIGTGGANASVGARRSFNRTPSGAMSV